VKGLIFGKGMFPQTLLRPTIDYILKVQTPDGAIPWFEGGKTDPWDHIEAAMGLSIGGEYTQAVAAYQWLADQQLKDGSWWAHYEGCEPIKGDRRETNFIAYCATGVWQHYLITQDRHFLETMFPMVEAAINFVLSHQAPTGEIYWAVNNDGTPRKDALVTACSSIYKSLECALNIANTLGLDSNAWLDARATLENTLHFHPECFDRTWESKARYSMDWFYPILAGVIKDGEARKRIEQRWPEFVEEGLGCRCVSDEPWVTVAESCELTMALLAAGDHARAVTVYSWLHQFLDSDGGYWTGYVFPDKAIWPEEKTTWTAGAILLAADALTEYSAASSLFTQVNLIATQESTAAREDRHRSSGQ